MNQRSDIDRLLRHWMDDGPSRMPDRIIDVVADRISVQRQRRSWRLLRRLPMNPLLKLTAAAAAVLIVAVVAWQVLPRNGGVGGQPTATPSPTPASTSTPVATGPIALREGTLTGGRYRLQPLSVAPSLSVVADIPSGWGGVPPWAMVGPTGEDATGGIAVAFLRADGLFRDPCRWDLDGTGTLGQAGVTVGPTVDDLVAALRANTSYTSSTATPLTIDGFEGQELEIQLPADVDFTTCDIEQGDASGHYYVFSGMDGGLYAQGPGNRWHLYVVDVGGTRLIVVVLDYEGTPAADQEAARAIVASLEFTP